MAKEEKLKSQIITNLRTKLLEDRTIEFALKTVTHQLNKDLLQFYSESIQQKQQILDEKKQKLEEIEEKIYNTENDFCESVWKFSREHDFGDFLINYPRDKTPPACNCEFYKETIERKKKELQENAEIKKLTFQVDALKIELETLINDKSLDEEIKIASEELKTVYEEDHEMQRLQKDLQNSQQELEFLQAEIEKYSQKEDLLLRKLEIDACPIKKKKKPTDREKSFKKLNFFQKTSEAIKNTPRDCPQERNNCVAQKGNEKIQSGLTKNPPLTCPNTIDNYLILKGNKPTPTERTTTQNEDKKLMDESEISNETKHQEKPGILTSWIWNSDDVSFSGVEDSIKEACTFLERTKTNFSREILSKPPNKLEIEDFEKPKLSASKISNLKYSPLRPLVAEQKSIYRSFTPKKQSAIAEKLLKK